VCQLAAAAEAASEHPLARAVLEYAEVMLHPKTAVAAGKSNSETAAASRSISGASPRKSAAKGAGRVTNGFSAVFSIEDDSAHSSGKIAFAEAEAAERRHRGGLDNKQGQGVGGWGHGGPSRGSQKGSSHVGSQADGWASGDLSPTNTPSRVRRIISTGLIKVSEVEVGALMSWVCGGGEG
jgi:hypothetical protein